MSLGMERTFLILLQCSSLEMLRLLGNEFPYFECGPNQYEWRLWLMSSKICSKMSSSLWTIFHQNETATFQNSLYTMTLPYIFLFFPLILGKPTNS